MKHALEVYAAAVQGHPRGLVSANDRPRVPDHINDSLAGLQALPELDAGPLSLVDIGSGGGFPAIPLVIVCEQLQVHVIDSVGWKTEFLQEISRELGLSERVTTLHSRAEDAISVLGRETFDIGTARAVSAPAVVAEYLAPFVRIGGLIALWSTGESFLELRDPSRQAEISEPLGLGEPEIVPVASQLRDDAVIIRWPKIAMTDKRFPRRAGSARRAPL